MHNCKACKARITLGIYCEVCERQVGLLADIDALTAELATLTEENIRLDRKRFENVTYARKYLAKLRTVTAEVDELRGKLDDVRMGIGCARGQRTTQYCAEAAQRDEVITKLLAMLLPGEEPKPEQYDGYDQLFRERLCRWNDNNKRYARACEIAGRTE